MCALGGISLVLQLLGSLVTAEAALEPHVTELDSCLELLQHASFVTDDNDCEPASQDVNGAPCPNGDSNYDGGVKLAPEPLCIRPLLQLLQRLAAAPLPAGDQSSCRSHSAGTAATIRGGAAVEEALGTKAVASVDAKVADAFDFDADEDMGTSSRAQPKAAKRAGVETKPGTGSNQADGACLHGRGVASVAEPRVEMQVQVIKVLVNLTNGQRANCEQILACQVSLVPLPPPS